MEIETFVREPLPTQSEIGTNPEVFGIHQKDGILGFTVK
jgi:hypothetical protein